jgi:hypothetical protein
VHKHQEQCKELDRIQHDIGKLDGLRGFLLLQTEEEIKDLAQNDSIVCFNASNISCEAFVITKTKVDVVSLLALNVEFVLAALDLIAVKGH